MTYTVVQCHSKTAFGLKMMHFVAKSLMSTVFKKCRNGLPAYKCVFFSRTTLGDPHCQIGATFRKSKTFYGHQSMNYTESHKLHAFWLMTEPALFALLWRQINATAQAGTYCDIVTTFYYHAAPLDTLFFIQRTHSLQYCAKIRRY